MYTKKIADEILARIENGEMLTRICEDPGMPRPGTVYNWTEGKGCPDPEFGSRFAQARKIGHEKIAEDTLSIADTPIMLEEHLLEEGVKVDGSYTKRALKRSDSYQHRRLQVETRLKLLAIWNPERFGNKPAKDTPDEESGTRVIIEGGLPDD